jgi:nitroreductase/NAD-dependent dihydropyrimidine dehydrogenase PreA subunit
MPNLFSIDKEKCKQEGICVSACAPRVIEMGQDGFPKSTEEAAEFCINCGHCMSACPHEALSLKTMSLENCAAIDGALIATRDQLEQWIRMRRSIRVFKEDPVPREVLEKLILAARYAPTGGNLQPVVWQVFENAADVRKIAGLVIDHWQELVDDRAETAFPIERMERWIRFWKQGYDPVFRHAPHLIINHGPWELPFADYACIIAMTHLDLLAPAFGLGTCWCGYLMGSANDYQPLVDELNLPDGHKVYGAMFAGYPDLNYQRLPARNEPFIFWR